MGVGGGGSTPQSAMQPWRRHALDRHRIRPLPRRGRAVQRWYQLDRERVPYRAYPAARRLQIKVPSPTHLLILKNIARDKPPSDLATQDNPATPNVGCAFAAPQLKVNYVPSSVLIGSSECDIFFQSRVDQCCAKLFGMNCGHPQEGLKYSCFMPSARMSRTQTIVSKFLNLDNRCLGVR